MPITAVSEVIVAVLDGADLPASSLTREAIFKSGPIHEKVTSHEDLPVIHVLTGLPTVGAARNAGVKQSNGEVDLRTPVDPFFQGCLYLTSSHDLLTSC